MTQHVQLRQDTEHRKTVQEVTLGGVRVRIHAQYVDFIDRWYISIHDLSDELIVGGIVCVPGVDLLRPYKHLGIPQGELFCFSKEREPPTFSTLDSSVRVLYR